MGIYDEIISWSSNKSLFIKDALRRLIGTSNLCDNDKNELYQIIKKENGFTGIEVIGVPISESDIPINSDEAENVTRLKSITNLNNICALHPQEARLDFENNELTLIYGKNGSGKSSYSRLLKKLCWSRDKAVELKKNIYSDDNSAQSASIIFFKNELETTFDWSEGDLTHSALNSVYVFDSNCASIYVNNENPAEYKPASVELLDKLVELCNDIEARLTTDIIANRVTKPEIDSKYLNTQLYRCYSSIENLTQDEIDSKLNFSDEQKERSLHLFALLQNNNPEAVQKQLDQKKTRYLTLKCEIKAVLDEFSKESIFKISDLVSDLHSKEIAYNIAKSDFNGDYNIKIGSDVWKKLWGAAKVFATSEVHPQSENYPDFEATDICVLCQQTLDVSAKDRMIKFDKFIQDKTSQDYNESKRIVDKIINKLSLLVLIKNDTLTEIIQEVEGFENSYNQLCIQISTIKEEAISYLNLISNKIDSIEFIDVILNIDELIEKIDLQIESNNNLIKDKQSLMNECLELEALESMSLKKSNIESYINAYKVCKLFEKCKSQIPKTAITRKIGEIQENQSITLLNQEFVMHISSLSADIARKVTIQKSRSSRGVAYQKCSFIGNSNKLSSVLSEGEQKIVALATFLSECTVRQAKNTIIFDDPVNSLDLDYRESIAKKIVVLSEERQIIVLTHDLYFLRLLLDTHKEKFGRSCKIIGLTKRDTLSGIPSDEIPYLIKNCQERINTIRTELSSINNTNGSETLKQHILASLRTKVRQLIERTVEEVIANRTIERFSKNLNVKSGNLANIVVTNNDDTTFLLSLFGKYSISEHDGGIETNSIIPDENVILEDIRLYQEWRILFLERVREFKRENNIR